MFLFVDYCWSLRPNELDEDCPPLCEMRNSNAGQLWVGLLLVAAEPSHADWGFIRTAISSRPNTGTSVTGSAPIVAATVAILLA